MGGAVNRQGTTALDRAPLIGHLQMELGASASLQKFWKISKLSVDADGQTHLCMQTVGRCGYVHALLCGWCRWVEDERWIINHGPPLPLSNPIIVCPGYNAGVIYGNTCEVSARFDDPALREPHLYCMAINVTYCEGGPSRSLSKNTGSNPTSMEAHLDLQASYLIYWSRPHSPNLLFLHDTCSGIVKLHPNIPNQYH